METLLHTATETTNEIIYFWNQIYGLTSLLSKRYSLANCQSFLSPKELQLKVFCFASLSTKEKGILQLVFHYEYTWVLLPTWNFSKMKEDILLTMFENCSKCRIWNFWILAFSTNFCPIKTDISGNTVWPQASGFQKLAKMHHFGHF